MEKIGPWPKRPARPDGHTRSLRSLSQCYMNKIKPSNMCNNPKCELQDWMAATVWLPHVIPMMRNEMELRPQPFPGEN